MYTKFVFPDSANNATDLSVSPSAVVHDCTATGRFAIKEPSCKHYKLCSLDKNGNFTQNIFECKSGLFSEIENSCVLSRNYVCPYSTTTTKESATSSSNATLSSVDVTVPAQVQPITTPQIVSGNSTLHEVNNTKESSKDPNPSNTSISLGDTHTITGNRTDEHLSVLPGNKTEEQPTAFQNPNSANSTITVGDTHPLSGNRTDEPLLVLPANKTEEQPTAVPNLTSSNTSNTAASNPSSANTTFIVSNINPIFGNRTDEDLSDNNSSKPIKITPNETLTSNSFIQTADNKPKETSTASNNTTLKNKPEEAPALTLDPTTSNYPIGLNVSNPTDKTNVTDAVFINHTEQTTKPNPSNATLPMSKVELHETDPLVPNTISNVPIPNTSSGNTVESPAKPIFVPPINQTEQIVPSVENSSTQSLESNHSNASNPVFINTPHETTSKTDPNSAHLSNGTLLVSHDEPNKTVPLDPISVATTPTLNTTNPSSGNTVQAPAVKPILVSSINQTDQIVPTVEKTSTESDLSNATLPVSNDAPHETAPLDPSSVATAPTSNTTNPSSGNTVEVPATQPILVSPINPTEPTPDDSSSASPTIECPDEGIYPVKEPGCNRFFMCHATADGRFVHTLLDCGVGEFFSNTNMSCVNDPSFECPYDVQTNSRVHTCDDEGLFAVKEAGCKRFITCRTKVDERIDTDVYTCGEDQVFSEKVSRCIADVDYECPYNEEEPSVASHTSADPTLPAIGSLQKGCGADNPERFTCPHTGRFVNNNSTDCGSYLLCLKSPANELLFATVNCELGTIFNERSSTCEDATRTKCNL